MGSHPKPTLLAMGFSELPTPKSSANRMGQTPAQHSEENICLITGEPGSPTAQGHHWGALEEVELRCGPHDKAIDGRCSQNTSSPQNQALCPPRVFVFCGDHHTGTQKGTSRSRQAQVYSPNPLVCHPPVISGFHFNLSDPSRQLQTHFADEKPKQRQGALVNARSQIKLPSPVGQINHRSHPSLSPVVHFLGM